MLLHEVGNFVWASDSGRGEISSSCKKFNGGERRAERGLKLLRARVSAELGKVASGSAAQDLWQEQESEISGSRRKPKPALREKQFGKLEQEEDEPATEQ